MWQRPLTPSGNSIKAPKDVSVRTFPSTSSSRDMAEYLFIIVRRVNKEGRVVSRLVIGENKN